MNTNSYYYPPQSQPGPKDNRSWWQKLGDWFTGEDEERKQREANEREYRNAWEMYNRQRSDALSDRDYENAYNSPQSIMSRYVAAGLNPNLIYGNSYTPAAGTRGASASGSPNVRTEYSRPKVGELADIIGNTVGGVSNLMTAKTVRAANIAQTALAGANTAKSIMDTAKTKQEVQQAHDLFGTTLQNAKLSGQKIAAETSAIGTRLEQGQERIDQADQKLALEARKVDQRDVQIEIEKRKLSIMSAKNQADIRKINEDILRSFVDRQVSGDVRQKLSAEISSSKSKAVIDAITSEYTSRILDAQMSKNSAEVAKLYSSMANDIVKSIPVLSYFIH